MQTPHLDELLKRIRHAHPDATIHIGVHGGASIVWNDPHVEDPLILLVSEQDLDTAVTDAENSGDHLWAGNSPQDACLNLLLIHLDEVLETRTITEPLRVTGDGLQWPDW